MNTIIDEAHNDYKIAKNNLDEHNTLIEVAQINGDVPLILRLDRLTFSQLYNEEFIKLQSKIDEYAFMLSRMIHKKDSISKNITNIIEMVEILLPIVKEKYIVSKIMSMKQDMELIKLKQEYKYLGLKRSEYGL
jgi:hypothetical protein